MRLKIVLEPESSNMSIPVNYNHLVAKSLRKKIKKNADVFRKYSELRDLGVLTGRFDIFTFSFLKFKNFTIEGNKIIIPSKDVFNFFISSPIDSFIEAMAVAFLRDKNLTIQWRERVTFHVVGISQIALPEFKEQMKLKLLSPLAISRKIRRGGAVKVRYLLPEEPDFIPALRRNLISKYRRLSGHMPQDTRFYLEFDREYIQERGGRFSKLIDIGASLVKCFLAPITVSGSIDLIKVGYEWGFGEKNWLGFGMAAISSESGKQSKG
jgi:CRISPR-associated endoribonuclease Cas6